MLRTAWAPAVAILMGCDDGQEIKTLRREVETLRDENATMKVSMPSEKPAVLKELEEAMKANAVLQREVITLQQALSLKASEIPKELLPFGKVIADLQARIDVLEKTASRKGHTHEYSDSCPVGTFNTRTKSTEAEK